MTLQELNDIEANRQRLERQRADLLNRRAYIEQNSKEPSDLKGFLMMVERDKRSISEALHEALKAEVPHIMARIDAELQRDIVNTDSLIRQKQALLDAYLSSPEPVMNFAPGSLPAESDPFYSI